MDLTTFQREAWRYDQYPEDPARGLAVALLGLGGEVGTLQTAQKKLVRDDEPRTDATAVAVEDIGDVLWYLADTATRLGIDLGTAAQTNLTKIAQRWQPHGYGFPYTVTTVSPSPPVLRGLRHLPAPRLYDATHDHAHRLPRQFQVVIAPADATEPDRVLPVWNGRPCGDRIGDNAYVADNYRFHDSFHLGYAAILGWSPVFRSIAGLKRKDHEVVDEVEDGGRAIAIEEGLSAFLFDEAERSGWYATVRRVSGDALALCRRMTASLEVREATDAEWEAAILAGFDAWRYLAENGSGVVCGDLDQRRMTIRSLTDEDRSAHRSAAAQWLKTYKAKARAKQRTLRSAG
jgi:NTP pyrophosphatase (non-canonical NTP hydrolase)